ncbi:hypothetical protein DF141_09560 [Burkholderia cenocepacia]|nr:hypothetical protein CFB44_23905 [Burkholderia sp. AU31280]RQU37213.1 hypothetical protein DF147_24650 [Burkholderia cenocepacia]RQU77871.1 hypothetical protein DF141_09560 [Burkholderia cenocepacia]RQU87948.1 hypothetical protein DF133_19885 [Burkholderia cenocepacia]RQV14047.1 hypothetical protein DF039_21945 [Burkholderia cenocepacia]
MLPHDESPEPGAGQAMRPANCSICCMCGPQGGRRGVRPREDKMVSRRKPPVHRVRVVARKALRSSNCPLRGRPDRACR